MKSRWSEHFSATNGDTFDFEYKNTEKYNKNCKELLLKNQTGTSALARPRETCLILKKILKNNNKKTEKTPFCKIKLERAL